MSAKLPPVLQKYVDFMAQENRPLMFSEVVDVCSPGRNSFWALIRRQLVVDTTPGYRRDEPYTGPKFSRYVLTDWGRALVSAPPPPQVETLTAAIESLAQRPGICPEALRLIELALEAQKAGRMPDLSALESPAELLGLHSASDTAALERSGSCRRQMGTPQRGG